jgi:drug/metabolite transporter (DMT)-like permease
MFSGCYAYALRYTPLIDAFLLLNSHTIIFLLSATAKDFSVEPLKLLGLVSCTIGAWLTTFDPGESGQGPGTLHRVRSTISVSISDKRTAFFYG